VLNYEKKLNWERLADISLDPSVVILQIRHQHIDIQINNVSEHLIMEKVSRSKNVFSSTVS
jgi:hypothetical protein